MPRTGRVEVKIVVDGETVGECKATFGHDAECAAAIHALCEALERWASEELLRS